MIEIQDRDARAEIGQDQGDILALAGGLPQPARDRTACENSSASMTFSFNGDTVSVPAFKG